MIYFLVLCLAFYDLQFLGINFADFGLIVFLFKIFFDKRMNYVTTTKATNILILLLLFLIFSYFEVSNRDYFQTVPYLTNFIRISIFLVGLLVIPKYLIKNNLTKKYIDFSLKIACIVSILAIIEISLKAIGLNINFQIPFLTKSYNVAYGELLRSTAFFSEPAHLCFYLSISLIQYLFYYQQLPNLHINNKQIILIVIGSFTTLSFGNIPLILIGLYIYYNLFFKTKKKSSLKYVTLLIFLISILVLFNTENIITNRLSDISYGEDGSSIHRTQGMLDLAEYIVSNEYYFGTGWGQKFNYLKAKNLYFENYYFTGEYSGINNTLVEILFGAGVVGLFIFLGFIYFHLRKYPILILTFIIMSFNGSHLNNSFFWMFLTFVSIYNYIKPLKQKYVD